MEASPLVQEQHTTEDSTPMTSFSKKAALYHERIPGLKRLPLPVVAIILSIGVANILVWVVVGIVLVSPTHFLSISVTNECSFSVLPQVRFLFQPWTNNC
jgi:high-affinity nickel-transport protein